MKRKIDQFYRKYLKEVEEYKSKIGHIYSKMEAYEGHRLEMLKPFLKAYNNKVLHYGLFRSINEEHIVTILFDEATNSILLKEENVILKKCDLGEIPQEKLPTPGSNYKRWLESLMSFKSIKTEEMKEFYQKIILAKQKKFEEEIDSYKQKIKDLQSKKKSLG